MNLIEWATGHVALAEAPVSVHFNELADASEYCSCERALDLAFGFLKRLGEVPGMGRQPNNGQPWPMVYFPIGSGTDSLLSWNEALWREVGRSEEPPSIFLLSRETLIANEWECYHRPINLPTPIEGLTAIFRSYRDKRHIENGWLEFDNGIYVFWSGSAIYSRGA